MIAFCCDACGKQFKLGPEFAGRSTTCTGCKTPLTVPLPDKGILAAPPSPRIAFSCVACGMKFNVKPEFAGRSTQCPTCKKPLVVPGIPAPIASDPTVGQIDGAPSSLARVHSSEGAPLVQHPSASSTVADLLRGKLDDAPRYIIEKELARGGMGAVMCALDCDIRREVAVKYLLDQSDDRKKIRFIEEAQITGQLEHPNIVPIHEIGLDADQRLFFSMKMVKGRSLAQILKSLRETPATAEKEYSLARLLGIFINVCHALAYAHSRAVVHRDLKPANIMVGDFGEVYVMDWGLAKVLRREAKRLAPTAAEVPSRDSAPLDPKPGTPESAQASVPIATPVTAVKTTAPTRGNTIATSRDLEEDLTQDGSILGTAVYMAPEQAAGRIDQIDERSDIYGMGAILYEILALQPPVEREGGFRSILDRVTSGQIRSPEVRAPERARSGKIPAELSAIAMKALARLPAERYPSVDSLRIDIERFLEGRSVSAKPDSVRETVVKLARRNKGATVASLIAGVILATVGVWSLIAILSANSRTQRAYDAYRAEQNEKREQGKRSAPALVRSARTLIAESQFDDALAHLETALNFNESLAEAYYLRAQILLSRNRDRDAIRDLDKCVDLAPESAPYRQLREAAADVNPSQIPTVLHLADVLNRQGAFTVADAVGKRAAATSATREEILRIYRPRIEAVWPGFGNSLAYTPAGTLRFVVYSQSTADLTALRGMPLEELRIGTFPNLGDISALKDCKTLRSLGFDSCGLSNLSPLRGLPLKTLSLGNCRNIVDFSPLRDLPLESLDIHNTRLADLEVLRGHKLKFLGVGSLPGVKDLGPLRGMPLEHLFLGGSRNVADLEPLTGMPLRELELKGCEKVRDLRPLKGMPLKKLDLSACGEITDLAPLQNLPLEQLLLIQMPKLRDLTPLGKITTLRQLNLQWSPKVNDLSPLRTIPLTELSISEAQTTDLRVLEGIPLEKLTISQGDAIRDLTPLRTLRLKKLHLSKCSQVTNLTPLEGLSIADLRLEGCPVRDLAPLRKLPISLLDLTGCKNVEDLTPLAGMELTSIVLPPQPVRGMEVLREMDTLVWINNLASAKFWAAWDLKNKK